MGGKSTTSTQQVTIPPEVLARYNAVNTRAESVAQQPFKQYGGQFVAPINQQQQAGFGNINQAAMSAQPFYNAAAGMTLGGSQGVGQLTSNQIGQYMSPYLGSVVGTTLQNLGQEQAIQRQGQIGDAIKAGAYGSDRSGLAAANLARQQGMAFGKTAADLLNQGYGQAVQTAVGQQGVQAQDLGRLMQGGAQLGGLGAAQQQAALQGAQAQIGAGTLEQQTQQADLTANYQQFLQERGYPFQVAQFLANIAMGTGALSGSTTTTTQPQTLFSDERMKENIEPVGELNDGQTIYRYNYRGDPRTQIGLIAQEVEQSHPEAVGESGGFRTVDYGRATDEAAEISRGGLMPEDADEIAMSSRGGLVPEGMGERMAFAPGGLVDPNDLKAIIESQAQSFGPFAQAGLYGGDKGGGLGASGYVPAAKLPTPKLVTAGAAPRPQASGLGQAIGAAGQVSDLGQRAAKAYDFGKEKLLGSAAVAETKNRDAVPAKRGAIGNEGKLGGGYLNPASGPAADLPAGGSKTASFEGGVMPSSEDLPDLSRMFANRGGLVPGYAAGGAMTPTNPYELTADPLQDVLEDQSKNEIEPLKPAPPPGGGGGGGLGDALKLAGSAASAAKGIGTLMAMLPFSDERLKDNIEPVGKLYDGQPVYRYNMDGGPTQIGLMAQEVDQRRPEAVGERGGYMTLDYDRATQDAAGGLMPREGFANGGVPGDEDLAIRTIAAEMSGKSPEEARAIAAVIENRLKSGRYGQTYGDVVKARGQFEPWSRPDAPNYPMRFTPDSQRYRDARAAFEARGDDPTGGAQNFFAPAAQRALGRREPSWARGREGMDIGQTRFFNLGEGGLKRPAATAAIDTAAPRGGLSGANQNELSSAVSSFAPPVPPANIGRPEPRGGLSGNIGTSGKPERKSSGISPPNKFGSEQGQDWGNFLTSRQFIVPLLSGIGAAATTPTRNLGTAIAAGLGAGAQAYGGLEKQMADVEQTRAQTRGIETDTFKKSIMDTAGGTWIWLTGGVPMLLGDYEKLARQGRAPTPMGRIPDNAEDILKKFREAKEAAPGPGATTPGATTPGATTPGATTSGAPAPGATTSGAPAPGDTAPGDTAPGDTAPGAPTAPVEKLPLPPPGLNYDKESQSTAESERSIAFSGGPAARTAQTITDNYIKVVVPAATEARDSARYLTELAANLSKATQGKKLDAPGFGFDGRAQIVSALNTLSRAFNGKGNEFGVAEEISETNKKIETLLSAARAAGGNQESFAALNALKQAVANPNMSPKAYAKLAADLLIHNQRAIDRETHRSMYANDSSGFLSKAAGDFERLNPASKYNEEADAIRRMILTSPDLITDLKSGKYTPAQIDKAFEPSGLKGMSRYFVGGR
jgi:hypothetical protein